MADLMEKVSSWLSLLPRISLGHFGYRHRHRPDFQR